MRTIDRIRAQRASRREALDARVSEWWVRHSNGETMQDIADSAGVTKQAISIALKNAGYITDRRAFTRARTIQAQMWIGRRFNMLTVVGIPFYDSSYEGWRVPCKCDCGNQLNVNVLQLEKGLRWNCGCARKRRNSSKGGTGSAVTK